jgi:hypothetical protein
MSVRTDDVNWTKPENTVNHVRWQEDQCTHAQAHTQNPNAPSALRTASCYSRVDSRSMHGCCLLAYSMKQSPS